MMKDQIEDTLESSTYEKPMIEFRETFEVIATTCLPVGIAKETPIACSDGPINS
jgi:hypothetical protein